MLTQLVHLLETKENGLSLAEISRGYESPTIGGSVHDRSACPKGEAARDRPRQSMLYHLRI